MPAEMLATALQVSAFAVQLSYFHSRFPRLSFGCSRSTLGFRHSRFRFRNFRPRSRDPRSRLGHLNIGSRICVPSLEMRGPDWSIRASDFAVGTSRGGSRTQIHPFPLQVRAFTLQVCAFALRFRVRSPHERFPYRIVHKKEPRTSRGSLCVESTCCVTPV